MSTIRASHILVDHEFEAQDLQKKLNDGQSFASLAASFSKCPSKKHGGDLGSFGKGRMVESFEEAAFSLSVGEVSDPVRTQFGYHLILRTE